MGKQITGTLTGAPLDLAAATTGISTTTPVSGQPGAIDALSSGELYVLDTTAAGVTQPLPNVTSDNLGTTYTFTNVIGGNVVTLTTTSTLFYGLGGAGTGVAQINTGTSATVVAVVIDEAAGTFGWVVLAS